MSFGFEVTHPPQGYWKTDSNIHVIRKNVRAIACEERRGISKTKKDGRSIKYITRIVQRKRLVSGGSETHENSVKGFSLSYPPVGIGTMALDY